MEGIGNEEREISKFQFSKIKKQFHFPKSFSPLNNHANLVIRVSKSQKRKVKYLS